MSGFHEDNFENFSEAMEGRHLMAEHTGDKVTITIDQEYGNSDLFDIEAFVKQIIATDELAFIKKPLHPFASIWHDLSLARYYPKINFFMEIYNEDFSYNPYIELFYENVFKMLGQDYVFLEEPYSDSVYGKYEADVFNELIIKIRSEANAKKFKRKSIYKRYNLSRGEKGVTYYIEKLFERFARLMVVRIDFFFFKINGNSISTSEARSYMSRFLNNKRSNAIFKNLIGYVWKLEDGRIRGPHFHCLFFFDGSKVCKDAFAGMKIGEYWKEITDSKGQFYNVNANLKFYLNPKFDIGIGMIDHYDLAKRRGLANIVNYFFKPEQYLSAKSLKKLRTYAHGEPPAIAGCGRPRTREAKPSNIAK